ncbi:hypothetical protein AB5J72_17170 [Streptomyces sp. CG1]|uniref:hypothetical protein n=1 Tax=Streptomyces sp. CG1 TaxID=1287523 RepID=UPI0034E2FAC9
MVHERLRLHLAALQRADLLLDVVEFVKAKKQAGATLEKRGTRVCLVSPHCRSKAAGLPDDMYFVEPPEPPEARVIHGYREALISSAISTATNTTSSRPLAVRTS